MDVTFTESESVAGGLISLFDGSGMIGSDPVSAKSISNGELKSFREPFRQRRDLVWFLYLPFVLTVSLTFASIADDPFITLRTAANLVHGFGPVFNAGQRVQGFTSPLHLALTSVLYLIPGGHDLLKLKLASLVFGVLAIREGARLIIGLDLPLWFERLACLAVSTSWIVAFSSGNGLETSLLMWLLIALARRLVLDGPNKSLPVLITLGAGAVLTRTDALAPLVAMAAAGLLLERNTEWRRRIAWLVGPIIAAVIIVIGEALYFGSVLPNTFYAKDMQVGRALSLGLGYLVDPFRKEVSAVVRPEGTVAIVFYVQIALLLLGLYALWKHLPRCWYLVAMLAGQVVFVLMSGGDWMIGGRFVAPAVIPLIIVEVLGVWSLVEFCRHHPRIGSSQGAALLGIAALVVASVLPLQSTNAPVWKIRGVDDQSLLASGQYGAFSQIWATLPGNLECLHSGQLVAASEVGYLGFARQDLRLLDLRGLTDRNIAMDAPTSDKWPWGVQDPKWYLSNSSVGRVITHERPVAIVTFDLAPTEILGGLYRVTRVMLFSQYSVSIYSRRGSSYPCR